MKVLIVSMTCGEGHNQIAKAIKNELDNRENVDSKIIQLYGFSNKKATRQNNAFLNSCKYIPRLYSYFWHKTLNRNPNKDSFYINSTIKNCKEYILKEINSYNPNAIICTHNDAGAVVDYLKRQGLLKNIKTYGIVFDYCLCPFWETNTNLDYILLPSEFMKDDIKLKGFKDSQILTYGLPVDEKFTKVLSKEEVRKSLNLDQNKFTITLYSGGNCISSAYKIIKQLEEYKNEIQLIAICGKNKKEYNRIEKYIKNNNITNVRLEGFCKTLDKYYSASDIAFTRGGGMGITEQINKNVPLVLREKLIINEKINKELFSNMGIAIKMNKLTDAKNILTELINNPNKLEEMKQKQKEIAKATSTKDFVNFVLKAQ